MAERPMARQGLQLLRQSLTHPHLRRLAEDMLGWTPTVIPPVVVIDTAALTEALSVLTQPRGGTHPEADSGETKPAHRHWPSLSDLTALDWFCILSLGSYMNLLWAIDVPPDMKAAMLINFLVTWVQVWMMRRR
jgi:hypothetical protein